MALVLALALDLALLSCPSSLFPQPCFRAGFKTRIAWWLGIAFLAFQTGWEAREARDPGEARGSQERLFWAILVSFYRAVLKVVLLGLIKTT